MTSNRGWIWNGSWLLCRAVQKYNGCRSVARIYGGMCNHTVPDAEAPQPERSMVDAGRLRRGFGSGCSSGARNDRATRRHAERSGPVQSGEPSLPERHSRDKPHLALWLALRATALARRLSADKLVPASIGPWTLEASRLQRRITNLRGRANDRCRGRRQLVLPPRL